MLKKTTAFFVALLLIFSVSATALAAEENLDSRLKAVTLAVKEKLDIGDAYTEFYGNLQEDKYLQYWSLQWYGKEDNVTVYAKEDGTILQYYRNYNDDYPIYDGSFAPTFPTVSREKAKKAATAFLDKVLAGNESVKFQENQTLSPVDSNQYYFYGVLQKNGLDTPDYVSISVYSANLSVCNFYRGDMYTHYVGDVPSATPSVSKADASALLAGKVSLELVYVPDGDQAVLRYVPVYNGTYIVDAQSGDLINIDDLYRAIPYTGAGASEAKQAADNGALTPAEQAGISKMEGVLQKDALDKAARAITALGISSSYQLGGAYYSLNPETGEVTCQLSYSLKVTSGKAAGITASEYNKLQQQNLEPTIYKYVGVDGKTGQLKDLYTIYSGFGSSTEEPKEDASLATKAEAFLAKYFGEQYAQSGLYDSSAFNNGTVTQQFFTYARKVNGYFFPTDTLSVTINSKTGTIDNFNSHWTKDITFANADGLVSADAALAAYVASQDIKLSYLGLPVKADDSDGGVRPYDSMYPSYLFEYRLAYSMENNAGVFGVDAKTGKVVTSDPYAGNITYSYSDLGGCFAKTQIETLAKYGIGFAGGTFQPTAQLTQLDMLLFLVSANGTYYQAGSMTDSEVDALYNTAYSLHILTRADRDPDRLITRAALAKTIVSMSGYGKAANLTSIYTCGFADDNQIAAEDYGYIAIAKGLGIIKGNASNKFLPKNVATRQEAAIMLYNFMSRNQA